MRWEIFPFYFWCWKRYCYQMKLGWHKMWSKSLRCITKFRNDLVQSGQVVSATPTPVEGEDASKITKTSSMLVVKLPFCKFSVVSHKAFAMVTQWCYIFILLFSKMFDIELCPLPFSMEEMFGFISCRFTGYPSSVQEQALLWLHVSVPSSQVLKHFMIL